MKFCKWYRRETSTKANQTPCVLQEGNEAVHHLHHNNSVRAYQEMVAQWIMNPCRRDMGNFMENAFPNSKTT